MQSQLKMCKIGVIIMMPGPKLNRAHLIITVKSHIHLPGCLMNWKWYGLWLWYHAWLALCTNAATAFTVAHNESCVRRSYCIWAPCYCKRNPLSVWDIQRWTKAFGKSHLRCVHTKTVIPLECNSQIIDNRTTSPKLMITNCHVYLQDIV